MVVKQQNLSNLKDMLVRVTPFCQFFILLLEILFTNDNNNSNNLGIKVFKRKLLHIAYADKSTFFLKEKCFVIEILKKLNTFSEL